jgi:hypothetical protein
VVAYRVALAAGEPTPRAARPRCASSCASTRPTRWPPTPIARWPPPARAPTLTADDRIARAQRPDRRHHWDAAVAELSADRRAAPKALRIRRDYWLGTALFKMRRRYADAGRLLLGVAAGDGLGRGAVPRRARAVAGRSTTTTPSATTARS